MLSDFETYRLTQASINDLSELTDATVVIQANFFLRRLLEKEDELPYEGLVSATGGLPYHLRSFIEDDFDRFERNGVNVLFMFDGLDAGKKFVPFRTQNTAVDRCVRAWDKYESGTSGEEARAGFRSTGALAVDTGYGLLQEICKERNVPFRIAPYKAIAQIAYLYQHGTDYIDAIAGPCDLLLYDVDRVIINLNMQQDRFSFIERSAWMAELGVPSHDSFVDACVLSGTSFLRPLPPKDRRIPEVLGMMRPGETGLGVCLRMQEDPVMIEADYLDRFRRTRMKIKHSIVLTTDGKVEPMDAENVPVDLHELVGQHLPDELYYYLSVGALGPRLLNDITSQELYEQAPLDGGVSDEYRLLVSEKLMPIKQTALVLLSKWLARAYQYREYTYRFWWDEGKVVKFKPAETGQPDVTVKSWKVAMDVLQSTAAFGNDQSSLQAVVEALSDSSFVSKSFPARAEQQKSKERLPETRPTPLSPAAISPNILFRFLHLRAYIDDKHNLTLWGQVLSSILSSLSSSTSTPLSSELTDAALLATELLRLNLLTTTDYWPTYARQSEEGTYKDRHSRTFLSRIASLLHLSHDSTGYSGRLSRRLLGYNRMITAVQTSLRDLLESCFATLLLQGDAPRDATEASDLDLLAISMDLPMRQPLNAALGIAVGHYLEMIDHVAPDFDPENPSGAAAGAEEEQRGRTNGEAKDGQVNGTAEEAKTEAEAAPVTNGDTQAQASSPVTSRSEDQEKARQIAWRNHLLHSNSTHPSNVATDSSQTLGTFFVNATVLEGDLKKVWGLWDAVFAGVKVAAKEKLIGEDVVGQWNEANVWLESRR